MKAANKLSTQNTRFLSDTDAAELLGVPVSSLRYWRILREGPVFYKVGRAVRYDADELLIWAKSRPGGGELVGGGAR